MCLCSRTRQTDRYAYIFAILNELKFSVVANPLRCSPIYFGQAWFCVARLLSLRVLLVVSLGTPPIINLRAPVDGGLFGVIHRRSRGIGMVVLLLMMMIMMVLVDVSDVFQLNERGLMNTQALGSVRLSIRSFVRPTVRSLAVVISIITR